MATHTSTHHTGDNEATILARVLGNEQGQLSSEIARHLLNADFNAQDKARMHELAVRNQEEALTAAEKEELFAFGRAGTLLSILKSKARKTLGIKPQGRVTS
jgi:hypothetical protein